MNGPSGVAPEALTALPKGGAAARAVDDVFTPRLATGSIAYRVPLAMPRGRVDDEVELALTYDQLGGGISSFGLGWDVVLPGIRRRTGHGIPRYDDLDVLVLTTGEQLVAIGGGEYRTEVDGFRRIRRVADGWEITEPDGTRYELGTSAESRVADPDDPARVFEWLVARRIDTNDNVVEYRWRHDDVHPRPPEGRPAGGVYPHEIRWCHAADGRPLCVARFVYDFTGPDAERPDATSSLLTGFALRMAWRCRSIVALCADLATTGAGAIELAAGHPAGPVDAAAFVASGALVDADAGVQVERWGAGAEGIAAAGPGALHVNLPIALAGVSAVLHVDARGRYELAAELIDGSTLALPLDAAAAGRHVVAVGGASPVRRLSVLAGAGRCLLGRLEYAAGNPRPVVSARHDLAYAATATEVAAIDRADVPPTTSMLESVTRIGYDAGRAETRMPPICFEYTCLDLSDLWPDTVTGSPREALSDPDTTLISFTGNARVDVLQTRNGHRCFVNGGRAGAAVAVQGQELASSPQVELSRSDTWLRDVNGRGSVDLSTESFYYHNPATSPTPVAPGALDWGDFEAFSEAEPHPVLTPGERPVTRAMDLDGDGNIDLLQTGADFVTWRNLGDRRWSPPQRQARHHSFGARDWPDVSLDDPAVTIADMNGDGLDDLVRVSARKVEYWAQAGGAFAFKHTMLGAPRIRSFNPRRCFVVDLTNDGFADLVYVGSGRVSVWLNQGGSRFAPELVIDLSDPAVSRGVRIPDDADAIEPVDLAGDGVKGILWSFTRNATEGNYYFLPLTRGPKPGLLRRIHNGLGGEIELEWTTSAVEAAQAEAVGQPWTAHSPFPVSALKRILKADRITGAVEQCDLSYRDAHHDRVGRRFLGFGEVTETFAGDAAGATRRIVHEFATRDVLRLTGAALAEARALAGRESRLRHVDAASGTLLQETVTAWAAPVVNDWSGGAPAGPLNPGDPLAQPRIVVATHELHAAWEGASSARYRLVERRYDAPGHPGVPDEHGNLREEIDHGEVALQGVGPALATIDVDGVGLAVHDVPDGTAKLTRYRYALDRAANIVRRVSAEETWAGPGFTQLVAEVRQYYDGGSGRDSHLPFGQVAQGNLQRRERLVAFESDVTAMFGPGFLGRIGAGAGNAPGHLLRADAADGRRALFAIELRRRFQRAGGRIRHGIVTGHFGPRGFETAIAYDDEGWAAALVTNALGHRTRVRRHSYAFGQPERIESAGGVVSRNDLDPLGRIVATWADDAAGAEPDVSWTYDFDVERAGAGTHTPAMVEQRQLIDRTEPQARHVRTRTFLDGFGRELQRRQTGEAGWIVHARGYGAQASMDREWLPYLDAGEDYAAPDGGRPVRRYLHDALGRLAETVSPDGSVERVTREPWVVIEHDREDTDPASPHHDTPRRVESDAAGRMTRVVDRIVYAPASEDAEAITLLRHDALGRLVGRRDPSGLIATTAWSADGRILRRIHPDAGERRTFHDAAGNRIYERDARGAAIWLRYDALDRVIAEVHGAVPSAAPAVTYTYDHAPSNGLGLLRTATTAATADGVTLGYDRRANVTSLSRRIDGQPHVIGQEHNALGLMRRRTYPSGDVLEQRFGVDGRVRSASHVPAATGNALATLSAIGWEPDGQLGRLEFLGGALTVAIAYDAQTLQIASIRATDAGGSTLQALVYAERDRVGNVLTLRDDATVGGPVTETYAYDSQYRVRRAVLAGGTVPGYAYAYAYALNGRLQRNGELASPAMVYDATHPNAPAGGYTWDANGNMLATPVLGTLVWDARDQLERAELADGSLTELYRYDHEGMRTRREVLAPGAAPSVTVHPDRDFEVRDGQPVVSITLGEARLGELDAAGGVRLYLLDQLSSVRGAADGAGAAIAALAERFRPYGASHVAPTAAKRRRFGGHERDASGLYWFDGRYYDAEVATWASADPAAQFHTPYLFAGGNPVNLVERDANDAVAVVFPDYRITGFGTKWSNLGHAGVLLIDNKTGLTKYYEYGRYDKPDRGIVQTHKVPDVKIKDGHPTKESLAAVLKVIARKSTGGSRIEGALIRTDKFKEMNQYAQDRLKLNKDKTREEYDLIDNNCGTFMVSTIEAGGVDLPAVVDPRPNSITEEIRSEHQTVDWSAKKGLKLGKPVVERDPEPAR